MLLAYGSMVKTAKEVRRLLLQEGMECALVNMRFAKPLDTQMLLQVAETYQLAVTMEENVITGGIGEAVSEYMRQNGFGIPVLQVAVPDMFVPHGNVEVLKRQIGLDAESIVHKIQTFLNKI